jgi:hypothetical protein
MINKYLLFLFPSAILVLVLHLLAISNDYYWILWWYDIPMHMLGGSVIVALYMWIAEAFPKLPRLSSCCRVLLLILIVGIAWEVWENLSELTSFEDKGYWFDTIHDIVDDVIGAGVMYWGINKFSK